MLRRADLGLDDFDGDFLPAQQAGDPIPDRRGAFVGSIVTTTMPDVRRQGQCPRNQTARGNEARDGALVVRRRAGARDGLRLDSRQHSQARCHAADRARGRRPRFWTPRPKMVATLPKTLPIIHSSHRT